MTPRTSGCSRVQREPPALLRSRLPQPLSRLGKGEVDSNPAPRAAASRGALGLCLPRGASDRHPALYGSSTPMIDTLRPVPFASEMAISKTVAWLNEQLELGNERLLLMDCRPQELYESSHIESAINVAIPGIMLRRLQKGSLPVRALFTRGEDRDRFTRRCGTDTVVLYDESSSDWNENTGGESVLGLLLKKLKDEGCRAFYLEGTSRGAPRRGARRRTPSCKLQAGRSAGASEPTAAPGVVCLSPGCEPSCVRHPRAWPARNRPASGRTLGPFLSNHLCFLPEMFFPYFLSFGF